MTRVADGRSARTQARLEAVDPNFTRQLARKIQGALHDRKQTALLDAEATRRLTERFRDTMVLGSEAELSRLTGDQRRQYEAVASKLGPAQRDQLRKMLVDGKLPGAQDLAGGQSLLQNLAKLATEPLGPGIDRKDILSQALQAIGDPSNVKQGGALTCGAATAQAMLAKQNPAEYVRILAGLASAEGKVKLAGGNTITRQNNWDKADIPGAANQLMQTAFMAEAAGGYDAANDLRADGKKGLYSDELAFLQEQITGKAVTELDGNSAEVMKKIAEQANGGKPVSVLVEGAGGGHYVQVKSVKDGKLTYIDPKDGQEHTVDAAQFQKQVRAANIEAKDGQKIRKRRPTQHKGILGGGCASFWKGVWNGIKSIGKGIWNGIKAVGKGIWNGIKAVGKGIWTGIKAIGKGIAWAAGKVWDAVKWVAEKAWEVAKTVGKALKWFWDKCGDYILLAAQIVSLFIPGCQGLALGIAAIQLAKGGVGLVKGIVNGDWREALGGGLGMVSAFAGGVGALGAKVVGQGLATAAKIAGRVAQVAGGVVGAVEGARTGNWGGFVAGVAGAVAGGAGAIAAGAGKTAETLSKWADKVNNLTNKGVGLANSIKSGDVFGAIANGTGAAAAGTGMVTDNKIANGVATGTNIAANVVNAGDKIGGKNGAIAVGGILGAAALGGGITLLALGKEGRDKLFENIGKVADDFGKGNYGQAGKDIAKTFGADPNGTLGKVLSVVTKVVGGGIDGVQAFLGVKDLKKKIDQGQTPDYNSLLKNKDQWRGSLQNTIGQFGLDFGAPESPDKKKAA